MSRRASLLAKQEKRKPRVRFPDELVFLDNIKDNDIQACHSMLRRASVQLDLNGLDSNGLTPLHNAVLEGNLGAVKLLVQHKADVNRQDVDTWTPLHAACANGEADIARFLLNHGAKKDIKTADGERPLDLCDARDFSVISVMLESDTARRARMLSSPDEGLEDEEEGEDNTDNAKSRDDDAENNNTLGGSGDSSDGFTLRLGSNKQEPVNGESKRPLKGCLKVKTTSDITTGMKELTTISEDNKYNGGNHSTSSPKLPNKSALKNSSSSQVPKITVQLPEHASKGGKSPGSSPGSNRKSPAETSLPKSRLGTSGRVASRVSGGGLTQ